MATLTIRNLSEKTRQALRERAARNGRSMEAEVRVMLGEVTQTEEPVAPVSVPPPEETLLTDREKMVLSPKQQEALRNLRRMFAPKPGERPGQLVDEFLAERRAEAERE